jgi:hypothetical protein
MRIASLVFVAALLAGSLFAGPITYYAYLDGPSESPVNASLGTGYAIVIFDTDAHTLAVNVTFGGLTGNTTASHIHCCTAVAGTGTAGVATITPTFTGFPGGVTSGLYDHSFDTSLASAFNPSFITAHGTVAGAETFLADGIAAGKAYLNIHTTSFAGGEIRGFLVPAPEPGTFLLAGIALVGLIVRRRR